MENGEQKYQFSDNYGIRGRKMLVLCWQGLRVVNDTALM